MSKKQDKKGIMVKKKTMERVRELDRVKGRYSHIPVFAITNEEIHHGYGYGYSYEDAYTGSFRKSTPRKVRKSGNAIVVTIPPHVLRHSDLELGDNVDIEVNERGGIEISRHQEALREEDDIMSIVDSVMDEYSVALSRLVER